MEVIQNRYGQDRVIEKLPSNKIRITGESLFIRKSEGCLLYTSDAADD